MENEETTTGVADNGNAGEITLEKTDLPGEIESPTITREDLEAVMKRQVKNNPKASEKVAKRVKKVIEESVEKPKKEPKLPKERYSVTVYFDGDEKVYIEKIIKARMEAGLTTDKAHFGRQAIDFAVNFNSEMKLNYFSVPDQPKLLLKNGIYEKRHSGKQ